MTVLVCFVNCSHIIEIRDKRITCEIPVPELMKQFTDNANLYNIAYGFGHYSKVSGWRYTEVDARDVWETVSKKNRPSLSNDECVLVEYEMNIKVPAYFHRIFDSYEQLLHMQKTVCTSGYSVYTVLHISDIDIIGNITIHMESELYYGGIQSIATAQIEDTFINSMLSDQIHSTIRILLNEILSDTTKQICSITVPQNKYRGIVYDRFISEPMK